METPSLSIKSNQERATPNADQVEQEVNLFSFRPGIAQMMLEMCLLIIRGPRIRVRPMCLKLVKPSNNCKRKNSQHNNPNPYPSSRENKLKT
ncbi:hypothetical protein EYB25_008285 [Talaromyces marneffei]|uniref:uncharacterized protein n=1 Tax=Talaromyces marneffei TaxID=37727 RepID=UPI0012A7A0B0|nr:uncharacterized protein EYB26_003348 [Talaromyces marneffei]KAE8549761.1 hypothetical protein EYB25_008285 [Talaromyces marneffei]QGA15688.1 hypothetical protein EYB26_003348 [Talaromyces marneffei]